MTDQLPLELRRVPCMPWRALRASHRAALTRLLRSSFFPATPEQAARGWSQDWSQYWKEHEALLNSGGFPPTAEQAAMGWSQNWEKWRPNPVFTAPDGANGRIMALDFTGGPVVRAAKQQAESEEHRWEKQQLLKQPVVKLAPAPAVPLVATLSTGATIPQLGLGTWKAKPGEVHDAVLFALTQAGYRHIDAAAVYDNEGEVGAALEKAFAGWDLRREEVWVTGKLWNTDHAAAKVEPALRKSLKLLRLEWLDVFMIHWPITGNKGATVTPSVQETWQAMELLVDAGLVKHLGVSNFSVAKLKDIQRYARVPISVCQCECHPRFRNDELVAFCAASNIHFTAYSPLGSPDSADIFKRGSSVALMDMPEVKEVAQRTGKNVGQVLIRWALQRRPHSSVLPKSVSEARIKGNAEVVGWALSDADMAVLNALRPQTRMVHGGLFLSPAGPYKTMKDLWDVNEE